MRQGIPRHTRFDCFHVESPTSGGTRVLRNVSDGGFSKKKGRSENVYRERTEALNPSPRASAHATRLAKRPQQTPWLPSLSLRRGDVFWISEADANSEATYAHPSVVAQEDVFNQSRIARSQAAVRNLAWYPPRVPSNGQQGAQDRLELSFRRRLC